MDPTTQKGACGPEPHRRRMCAQQAPSATPMTWTHLPAEALERAPKRIAWVAVLCAFITVAMFTLQAQLQPEVRAAQSRLEVQVAEGALLAMALVLSLLYRFGWIQPATMLRLATFFQIQVAFSLALFENAMPWPADQPMRGMSSLMAWIVGSSLMIPASPLQALIGAIVSALMGPLAYWYSIRWMGNPEMAANRLLILYVPPLLTAFCAWFMSRLMLRVESSAARVKDMGSYDLESQLGVGGMGEVWRARHRLLKREAAVKLIRSEVLVAQTGRQAEVLRRRFEQEARATAALTSPHTVSLFDFGQDDGGNFYYAMELLHGMDLEQLVKRFGPLPAGRAVWILKQACNSLEEAHCKGMVHRDIKPTNLFLCHLGVQFDFCKLLDFGLTKWRTPSEGGRMTMENVTTGTPAYMAPELALGSEQTDGRADLYGVGCVAFWLLTGRLVFDESTPTAMALAHVQKDALPPSRVSEMKISPELDRVVLQCLQKKPEDRPASAKALRKMLEGCDEARQWTCDDAERWWRKNMPDVFADRCDAEAVEAAGGAGQSR